MASSTKYPGTTASSGGDSVVWSNHANVKVADDTYADAIGDVNTALNYTNYLKATNFGFSIPTGATIDGITVGIDRKALASTIGKRVYDYHLFIIKADASLGTTDKAATSAIWPTGETLATYGSSSDKWDLSWESADINDSDFGVALEAKIQSDIINKIAGRGYVDDIYITVSYTEAASGPALLKTVNGLAKASVKTLRSGLVIASGKTFNGLA